MREFELIIPKEYSGYTIKQILKNHFKFSSKLITALKSGDGITLSGKKEFVTKVVCEGEILKLKLPDKQSENILPERMELNILYEDDDILAVNKPHGIPTHPSVYHFSGTLANGIMYYYRNLPFTFRAPSRLDRDTSGALIIAKNAFAAAEISRQIKEQSFKKEYVALTCGIPNPEKGVIDAPIKREAEGIIKRCIAEDGKTAITEYEVIEAKDGFALVCLHPKTGRTHQIRLHLSHIKTPIYADFLYGTDIENERIRLHCKSVEFVHPIKRDTIKIIAPLPEDMSISSVVNK